MRGQVIDTDTRQPIPGVHIRIEGVLGATSSDELGFFALSNLPAGDLVVVAEGEGIEPVRVEVWEQARSRHVMVFARRAIMPEYTATAVTSSAHPLTASTSHITARELSAFPRRNAEDALRLVPGFVLVQHGSEGKGHQFFLRGFDAAHGADLEVTVSGIPVNEWSNIHAQGYIDLGFIVPEAIQSVEVTKGPFTLDQGAFAMAGSADYTLGIAEEQRGALTKYTVGTTQRHRGLFTYSPRDGDGQDFIAVEAMHDDGFGENRSIDRGALLGRVRLLDDASLGTLSLLSSAYLARFDLPGTLRNEDVAAGRVGFYDAYDHAGNGRSGRGLLALSHELRHGDHLLRSTLYGAYRRLELLENYTGFLVDPVQGDRREQAQTSWSFGASIRYAQQLSGALQLEAGLGVRGDVLDQEQQHIDLQLRPLETERALKGLQTLSHALVGLRFRPMRRLRLAAGARVDVAHASVRDELDGAQRASGVKAAVSPRATLEYRVRPPLRLFAAYGRGFRPPEARSFTRFKPERTGISQDLFDGSDPRMTVTDSVELGTRFVPGPLFGASLSTFATWIERETIFDHVSGLNLELNSTRRLGAELQLQSSPLEWLSLHADVTYVDARFLASGRPIPLVPALVGSCRAIIAHASGLRAGLRFTGLTSRPLPHGARGATLTVLDASVGYVWQSLSIDLQVENVLNQRVREGEYHFASHFRPDEDPSELPVIHYVPGPPLNARLSVSAVF